MLRIRLQRKGRKKRPIYHVVVADSRNARDGRIIEQVGRYDNVTEKKEVVLNEDRIFYWLDTGAQPSDTVRKILRNEGLLYKRHLMMWGKSENEIESALTEWKSYRDSKQASEASRKETYKEVLAAEEKEYKNQVEKKASKAAAEIEAEAAVEETVDAEETAVEAEATEEAAAEEAVAEVVEEEQAEVATEETAEAEEAPVAEETAAEEAVEEVAEEAPAEAAAEEVADEAPAEEETEVAEEEVVAEETKEEPAAEATQTSSDMTAKDAIDHIRNTELDALKGFVTGDEDRKTVLAAWESKQEG